MAVEARAARGGCTGRDDIRGDSSVSVLVVGSVALDNVKTPFGEVTDAQGGSCSYASVSASYFAPTAVVGVVGGDYPKTHLGLLRRKGVDTSGLQTVRDGKTFRWAGYYEFDMNQADAHSPRDAARIRAEGSAAPASHPPFSGCSES